MIQFEGEIVNYKLREFQSADGIQHKGAEYVIREVNAQYPDTLCFSVFDQKFMDAKIKPGQYGVVKLSHRVQESYQSKTLYNRFSFVSFEQVQKPVTPSAPQQTSTAPAEKKEGELPF